MILHIVILRVRIVFLGVRIVTLNEHTVILSVAKNLSPLSSRYQSQSSVKVLRYAQDDIWSTGRHLEFRATNGVQGGMSLV